MKNAWFKNLPSRKYECYCLQFLHFISFQMCAGVQVVWNQVEHLAVMQLTSAE